MSYIGVFWWVQEVDSYYKLLYTKKYEVTPSGFPPKRHADEWPKAGLAKGLNGEYTDYPRGIVFKSPVDDLFHVYSGLRDPNSQFKSLLIKNFYLPESTVFEYNQYYLFNGDTIENPAPCIGIFWYYKSGKKFIVEPYRRHTIKDPHAEDMGIFIVSSYAHYDVWGDEGKSGEYDEMSRGRVAYRKPNKDSNTPGTYKVITGQENLPQLLKQKIIAQFRLESANVEWDTDFHYGPISEAWAVLSKYS